MVKILPPSKADRHWIIPKGNKHIGWVPHSNEYVAIFATKAPSMHDLNKLLEKCPYTETVNFAMTVKNIMIYANEIGWTEDNQIEIFLLICCQPVA